MTSDRTASRTFGLAFAAIFLGILILNAVAG